MLRVVIAAGVLTTHAPPADTILQALHFQIPTATRLVDCLPQNTQWYFACCEISIFFTCFRSEAPYLKYRGRKRALILISRPPNQPGAEPGEAKIGR